MCCDRPGVREAPVDEVAFGRYTRSLQIAERLAAADPTHTAHQRNLDTPGP
jgi:hypothetical protein